MAVKTGDDCEHCKDGWYVVTSSHRRKLRQMRYLACWKCRHRPRDSKQAVPLDAIQHRRRRAA